MRLEILSYALYNVPKYAQMSNFNRNVYFSNFNITFFFYICNNFIFIYIFIYKHCRQEFESLDHHSISLQPIRSFSL